MHKYWRTKNQKQRNCVNARTWKEVLWEPLKIKHCSWKTGERKKYINTADQIRALKLDAAELACLSSKDRIENSVLSLTKVKPYITKHTNILREKK